MPSTVVSIGENAFDGTNYTMCKTGATVPPTLTANTFSSTMVAAMVPESSIADYRAAAVWEDYVLISGENHAEVTVTTAGQLAVDILEQCKIAPAKVTHLKVHGPLNATDFAVIRSNMTVLYNLDLTDADVESIPQNALLDKLMLGSLKLPAKLVMIEKGAFSGCTSLNDTITLPASLSTIGDRAFYNCSRLKGVEWSEALTKIGTEAFSGCNSLKQELTFPDKLETINNNAFYNCSSLYGTVTMLASLKSMPAGRTENNWEYSGAAFYGCSNIAGVDMQKCVNLQGIGGNAFSGCSQLQTVLLPNTLTAIPKYAFDGCVKLDDVEFPDSLTTIGEYAFQGCASLTVADFSNCKNMRSIDGYAFSGCSALSTVNLPESLTQINTYAFMDCKKLYNLSAANVVPATLGEYVFRRVNTDVCLLSIPTTSFYDYLIAAQWGAFVEMRAVIENHIDEGGRVTGENVNAEITEDVESDSVKSDGQRYAVIRDGSSVFVPKNGRIRYRVSPDENVSVKAVKYNDKDVTAELVDNVFTTPEVVEDGTLEVQFNVEGPINVTNVTLDRKKVNLLIAESTTLVAEVSPRNATNKSLSWSSSDVKVARVDNAGKVTAVAPGVADITVTTADGAIYAQSRVTVLSNNYYFTMPETSAFVNTSLTVPVSMHNDEAVSGFQCDIYLPEGVEISSQYGDYNVSYAGRSSDHVLVTAKQNDGAIRVLGYSANNNSYNGNDGVLFNLPIETSGVIGGKEIKIKNIHVAGPEAIDFAAPDISMTLNVNDYSLGDSNGDGNVTVSDVTNTANYVLNKYVSKFVFDAADVNADKAITIADVTGTASITLGQWGGNASSKAKGYNINTVETADRLYVEDFTIADGEEKTISFMLNNSVAYVGVQFDLYLPEGLTAVKDKYGDYTFELAEDRKGEKNYLLGSQLQPTGAVRVLANPSNNTPFVGNEGAIMTLTLKADGLKAGTHQIKIGNIKFSDALAAHDYDLPEAETTVTVNPTDVTNIGETVGHKDDIIYNINGVRVERPTTSGLYIVNGKTYRHK